MERLNPQTCKIIPGKNYGTPKEIWGFRTLASHREPVVAARDFVQTNGDFLGIAPLIVRLRLYRVMESLGAWHVIFQQRHLGMKIHRAYVTVHLDRERRAYLVKYRAVPLGMLPSKVRLPSISPSLDAIGHSGAKGGDDLAD